MIDQMKNNGSDFFVTRPHSLNDYFKAKDAIENMKGENIEKKEELIEDLGSLFDEVEPHHESLFAPENQEGIDEI